MLYCTLSNAQTSGNIVYSDTKLTELVPLTHPEEDNSVIVEARVIYNAVADNYLAVFNVNQLEETATLANSLIETRLNGVRKEFLDLGIKTNDIYMDMISFVPEYEYEVQKKLFSKSYNEIPKGFRLQKNIHVKYKSSKLLDKLIAACAKYEIYDLVKVEYYSENSKDYYDSLRIAAKKVLKEKMRDYKEMGVATENGFFQISEKTFVKYPQEQYSNYQAFNNINMDVVKKSSYTNQQSKNTSYFYNPVSYKGYDIVFNPIIIEPVIQYALTMKMRLSMKNPTDDKDIEYYILTPSGELKTMKK